jgi:diguanylate cyclase (GGDEF)-like protein/PAS domain S-box-containing protein
MKIWSGLGLQTRLVTTLGVLLLTAAGLQAHLSMRAAATAAHAQLANEVQELLPLLTPLIAEQAVIGDYATIRQMLKAQVDHRVDIDRIVWTDMRGLALEVDKPKIEAAVPRWFSAYLDMTPRPLSQRVILGGVDYGELTAYVISTPTENALWEQFLHLTWQLTLAISLVFMAIALIMRANLTVVRSLAASAQRFSRGDHSVRIPERGSPELRSAAYAFNDMATQIGDLVSTLSVSRNEFREQLHFTQELIEALPTPIYFKDSEGRYIGVNRAWESFFSIARGTALGRTVHDIYSRDPQFAAYQHSKDKLLWERPGCQAYDAILTSADKKLRNVVYYQATFTNTDGKMAGLIGTIVDITDRKEDEEKLRRLAYYDPLTELPNRLLCMEQLRQAMSAAERSGRKVAILYIDLDRFKYINDSLGYDVGDKLLKLVAQRLRELMRPGDTVSRFGGDEFTVLLEDVEHVEDVTRLAQRIIDCFMQPLHVAERELFSTPSIGITLYPLDADNAENLIKNADAAVHHAKNRGGSTFQFYTSEMNLRTARRLAIETALRHALERGEITLHYQPQVDLTTGHVIGAEALLRWQHPEFGSISPVEFIPIAEEVGLILPMGEWALRTACAQLRAWQDVGFRDLRIAVNLSSRQLQQGRLVPQVRAALAQAGLDGRYLELELTESMLIHDSEINRAAFAELDALGVKFSVDDFGTGYSSLSYLKLFPIDAVKIDRSFLRGVPNDPDSVAIAAAIIAMARSLGIGAVAEGVETVDQLEFLRRRGCATMQGYYFSKPIPAAEFTAMLKEGRRLLLQPLAGVTSLFMPRRKAPAA